MASKLVRDAIEGAKDPLAQDEAPVSEYVDDAIVELRSAAYPLIDFFAGFFCQMTRPYVTKPVTR